MNKENTTEPLKFNCCVCKDRGWVLPSNGKLKVMTNQFNEPCYDNIKESEVMIKCKCLINQKGI